MCIASMFDGHIRNIGNIDFSIYWTFTISALLEFPADMLAIFGLNIIGRRWSAFLSQALAGLCMIVTAYCLRKADITKKEKSSQFMERNSISFSFQTMMFCPPSGP